MPIGFSEGEINAFRATQQQVFAAIVQQAASILNCGRELLQTQFNHFVSLKLNQEIELTIKAALFNLNGLEI